MKYGLIGKHISHSLSNKLHPLIARMNDYDVSYDLIDIDTSSLKDYVDLLKKGIYQGYNITTPYKQTIIPFLDVVSEEVSRIGACNTVMVKEGKLYGYNTDHYGFLKTIETHNIPRSDAYILGTGGAARICYDVLVRKGFNVFVVSRTPRVDDYFKTMLSYEDFYRIKEIPLLVNATPVGAYPSTLSPIKDTNQAIHTVIDLLYNPKVTTIMKRGKESINGMEMLIYQGILSQSIWQNKTLKEDLESINYLKGALYEHIR